MPAHYGQLDVVYRAARWLFKLLLCETEDHKKRLEIISLDCRGNFYDSELKNRSNKPNGIVIKAAFV